MSLTKKRIENVFNGALENIASGKEPNVQGEMRKVGYRESSVRASMVTRTKTWKQCLAKINDEGLINRLNDIAFNEDKRSSLQAIHMLLNLKDKYPDKKFKISSQEEREQVFTMPKL